MAGQLIPLPGMELSVSKDATPQQCISAWLDLMRTCDRFLYAGLRRKTGPEGDIKSASREWYARQCEEHHDKLCHMLTRMNGVGGRNAD